MAYASLAGLPPMAGLWAILAPLALYAVLGSSRQLSVGPESTTALMTATAVAPLAPAVEKAPPASTATVNAIVPARTPPPVDSRGSLSAPRPSIWP
jgi:MFS superfamily sulfate permease-like transporter